MIRFERVSKNNLDQAVNISVTDKQKHKIADVVYSLAEAYLHPNTLEPVLVLDKDTPVGFVLFYINPEESVYKFGRVMIDQKYQGQGYGRQNMLLGIKYLKSKGAKKLVLSHSTNNPYPSKLYLSLGFTYTSLGFKYTGVIDEGEEMMELIVKC